MRVFFHLKFSKYSSKLKTLNILLGLHSENMLAFHFAAIHLTCPIKGMFVGLTQFGVDPNRPQAESSIGRIIVNTKNRCL